MMTGCSKQNAVLALDLGTTNIAAVLLVDGKQVRTWQLENPQLRFGGDVMTRIKHAMGGKGEVLHTVLVEALSKLVGEANKEGVRPKTMWVSGNTFMLHTLLNQSVLGMGVAPYTPVFLNAQQVVWEPLGIVLETLPCIAAFAGGDVVAGMLAAGTPKQGQKNVLVDLGTNAEIAVWDEVQGVVTSAAAGNCFAAGKMKGTELIDTMAAMLEDGTVDETGALQKAEETRKTGITKKRIREFQMAKAAVRTALDILLSHLNLTAEGVDTVYLSGGFSEHISVKNAVRCGLLPKRLMGKCVAIGNSSLQGAILAATGSDTLALAKRCTYLSLNHVLDFNERLIENIGFWEET